MANPEHLEFLKQGVNVWNEWRSKHVDVLPDRSDVQLIAANLSGAQLSGANFTHVHLKHADLSRANLSSADFSRVYFSVTDFTDVSSDETTFTNNDLSEVKGLETVKHRAPSSIGTDTLYRPAGKIPEVFLRGCGLQGSCRAAGDAGHEAQKCEDFIPGEALCLTRKHLGLKR
jgi:uncharacterized protein YjbI with pentapeptide repeats